MIYFTRWNFFLNSVLVAAMSRIKEKSITWTNRKV